MIRHSYAEYGCAVFADNARTYAYHLYACENGLYPSECGEPEIFNDCSCDLDNLYIPVSPSADPAPWYDVNDPASSEFLGAMIISIDGIDDSTVSRTPVDALGDGTILNRARLAGRSFNMELLLLSTSCRGQDFGVEWLRRVFETRICLCGDDPCGSCYGQRLTIRKSCDGDTPCDTGLRSWESVGVVDGIKHVKDDAIDSLCCTAKKVSVVLQAESPYSYGCESVECNTAASNTLFEVCYDWATGCLDDDSCCTGADKQCDRCLYDPLCDCYKFVDPVPQTITTENSCYCEPLSRYVQCCCIDDVGNAAYDTALKIEVFSGFDTAMDADGLAFTELGLRNMRLSIFNNPDNIACITDETSYQDWCATRPTPLFEVQIPYIPSNATLTIDGKSNRVFMECDGSCRPFPYSIESAKGSLFPLIANCNSIMACIEWDSLNTQLKTGAGKAPSIATITSYRRWMS